MTYILWSMEELYRIAKSWQEKEFDGIIVFDGNRGISKSTGAFKFCSKFDDFRPKRDIAYSREDVTKLVSEKRKGIIMADEMINVTFNREFYSEEQKMLIKILNMCRDNCNILVCCVPNFYDLDKQFRNMVKIRINVIRRGIGIIHTKNHSSYSQDKWDSALNEKIEKSWLQKNIFKPRYDKLTTYRGFISYGPLGPKQEQIYKSIKEDKRNRLIDEDKIKKPKDLYNELYLKLKDGKINRDKIQIWADVQGVPLNRVLSNLQVRARNENTTLKLIESKNQLINVITDIPRQIQKNEKGELRLPVI